MGQLSITRIVNLSLQALFILVMGIVMAQKMRGKDAKTPRKGTPGVHVVEVGGDEVSGNSKGEELSPDELERSKLIVTEASPFEPFQPYDAVPKAVAAKAAGIEPGESSDTEDEIDRLLKKFDHHCPPQRISGCELHSPLTEKGK